MNSEGSKIFGLCKYHYVRIQETDTGMRFSYAWRKIQGAKKHGVSKEPTK